MSAATDSLQPVRLLLPVKALDKAKSRLRLDDAARRTVARWLFENTLDVALECVHPGQVFVVTSDGWVTQAAAQRNVAALDDTSGELNASVDRGLRSLRRRFPSAPLAVLVTDLPMLTPSVLRSALTDAGTSACPRHVVDHRGTGTTFLSIPPRMTFRMQFGPDSARRFSDAGSEAMPFPPREITHDLDFLVDLEALTPQQKETLCPTTALL
jgi:2-phospho-L-lactate guanylyltransferase